MKSPQLVAGASAPFNFSYYTAVEAIRKGWLPRELAEGYEKMSKINPLAWWLPIVKIDQARLLGYVFLLTALIFPCFIQMVNGNYVVEWDWKAWVVFTLISIPVIVTAILASLWADIYEKSGCVPWDFESHVSTLVTHCFPGVSPLDMSRSCGHLRFKKTVIERITVLAEEVIISELLLGPLAARTVGKKQTLEEVIESAYQLGLVGSLNHEPFFRAAEPKVAHLRKLVGTNPASRKKAVATAVLV